MFQRKYKTIKNTLNLSIIKKLTSLKFAIRKLYLNSFQVLNQGYSPAEPLGTKGSFTQAIRI
jgi:hypothetical protein